MLISYDGEVKIIDFGIAKATLHHSETQAGLLKGKFSYMSPEQVQGFPIDHRSDIFAIGTVLFEMLTSQSLFRGENDFITLERVRKAEVPNPTDINPKIPKSLEKIVMKALALDPNDRWQRAADFQDALQRFLITSPPIYTAKRLADWMKLTFAPDIDQDKGRMEEYSKLGPEVLRRSIPPSQPPPPKPGAAGGKMKKTIMGMPAVPGMPPPAPAPGAAPPGGPPVGAVAKPIADPRPPETTKPGGTGSVPPPIRAPGISQPPPPPLMVTPSKARLEPITAKDQPNIRVTTVTPRRWNVKPGWISARMCHNNIRTTQVPRKTCNCSRSSNRRQEAIRTAFSRAKAYKAPIHQRSVLENSSPASST